MPTYDYTCSNCGHKMEALQKITDNPLRICSTCHKETLLRAFGGGIGISLTGDGFYKTMYNSDTDTSSNSSSSNNGGGCCPCGKGKNACSSNSNT